MRGSSASRWLCGGLLLAAALLSPLAAQAQAPAASAKPGAAIIPPAVSQGTPAQNAAAPAKPDAKASAAPAAAKNDAPSSAAAPAGDKPASQTSGVVGTQNPAASASPPPLGPPVDVNAAMPPTDAGLCQCIGNFKTLDIRCPASADSCHSQCGNRFSFVPAAQCTPVER